MLAYFSFTNYPNVIKPCMILPPKNENFLHNGYIDTQSHFYTKLTDLCVILMSLSWKYSHLQRDVRLLGPGCEVATAILFWSVLHTSSHPTRNISEAENFAPKTSLLTCSDVEFFIGLFTSIVYHE